MLADRGRVSPWRRRIPERSQQCCLQASGRSAPPRWSAPSRSRPTSAPGSRSSTRCAPPCSRSVSASSPERRRRSSRTPTTSRSSTPPGARRTGTRRRSCSATTSRTEPRSSSSTRPTPRRSLRSTEAYVGAGRRPEVRAALIEDAIANAGPRARDAFATMCEVAQRFAGWLGLGSDIQAALEYVFARWDGRGFPDAARRRDPVADAAPARGAGHLPLPLRRGPRRGTGRRRASNGRRVRPAARRARRAELRRPPRRAGRDADVGAGARERAVSRRSGSRATGSTPPSRPSPRSPVSSRRGCASTRRVWPSSPRPPPGAWASRPTPSPSCGAPRSRTTSAASACRMRSGRSRDPSGSGSGSACDCTRTSPSAPSPSRRRSLRSGSWPARTTSGSTAPATTAARAGRRSISRPASSPPPTATAAMREARPYRPALDAPAAEAELLREAEEGRLDPEAVDAVLAAAGHRVRQRPRELPAGLTERELEVLLVLVRGESNQEIAEDLGISAKTVGHHVQHVYQKAGVRSRAAATVWAFEHDLVHSGIGRSPDAARAPGAAYSPHHRRRAAAPRTTEEERDDPGNDDGRGLRPLPEDLLDQGRREAKAARVQGRAASFAIPTRTTGSG